VVFLVAFALGVTRLLAVERLDAALFFVPLALAFIVDLVLVLEVDLALALGLDLALGLGLAVVLVFLPVADFVAILLSPNE
jgi:hypothetical protein